MDQSPRARHAVDFRDSLHNVVHVFDDMDGTNFVKARVRERQRMIQICNDIRCGGVGIRIHADRSRSFIAATT